MNKGAKFTQNRYSSAFVNFFSTYYKRTQKTDFQGKYYDGMRVISMLIDYLKRIQIEDDILSTVTFNLQWISKKL